MPVIVNREHKFIFLHVPKTAGNSIINFMNERSDGNELLQTKNKVISHARPNQIKKIVGEETWNSYFKFGFMRNPYEWIVSLYLYRRRTVGKARGMTKLGLERGFCNFVQSKFVKHKERLQKSWMPDHPRSKTSFIGDYSCLQSDFDLITSYMGLPSGELPKVNVGSKTEQLVKQCYNDDTGIIQNVTALLHEDIELYNSLFNKRAINER